MYKVFFKDKLVLLTDEDNSATNLLGFLCVSYDHPEEIREYLDLLNDTDSFKGLILYSKDLKNLWSDFCSHFKIIEAAGGLVKNARSELLFIYRNDVWDLPKGKLEGDEKSPEGALREVEEECGVEDLKLGEHIIDTYHVYPWKGEEVLKRTYWYEMESNQEAFIPQLEEGITKVEWVKIAPDAISDFETYPNIKLVLEASLT